MKIHPRQQTLSFHRYGPLLFRGVLLLIVLLTPLQEALARSSKKLPVTSNRIETATQNSTDFSNLIFKYLSAEYFAMTNHPQHAYELFFELAQTTQEAKLAKKATQVAFQLGSPLLSYQAVSLWAKLSPESAQAQQLAIQLAITLEDIASLEKTLPDLLHISQDHEKDFLSLTTLSNRNLDKKALLALAQRLSELYPEDASGHLLIAYIANQMNQLDLALKEASLANQLRPRWPLGVIEKANILYKKSPQLAIDFMEAILREYPNWDEIRLHFTKVLMGMNQLKLAQKTLNGSQEQNAETLTMAGLIALQLDELTTARKAFQQALKIEPDNAEQIYFYLGQIAERQKKWTTAQDFYKKISKKISPYWIESQLGIARILSEHKNTAAAIDFLASLNDLTDAQSESITRIQANLLTKAGRQEEAFKLLESTVQSMPNMPELRYDFAILAGDLSRFDIMETELQTLIKTYPNYAQPYNALGYSLADQNIRLEEALALVTKALSLSPDNPYIFDSMGWVEYRMGNFASAETWLQKAYALKADPEISAHWGEVMWMQGREKEALQKWREGLSLSSKQHLILEAMKRLGAKF